ncbi:ABC transporter substrate-binding protein [Corynebacterium sp. HMSC04H06]|uniref:ABC transporter substrate-binding protein n=1 Tax=Corynebacterium sp. HMSC04H06 TaxID=1581050 RepID=UPI0008A37F7E|nr:ABC transporter substrate-binding protein [Corynebacterium sp. HMSC04H06]OFS21770.1 ferrisiderophore receptor Irp6A [Corynebacterium sp. HMSC04H06]
MKKILAAVAATALVFGAAGCSSDSADNGSNGSNGSNGASQVNQDGTKAENSALTVHDAAGRTVEFAEQPERIILAEGRNTFVTSILQDDPFENVVAFGSDLTKAAPKFEEKLYGLNPAAKDLPEIGNIAKGDVTVENLLAQDPDVVVMSLDHKDGAEKTGFLDDLDKAGVTYVFTDFRQKPLENTTTSVKLLGDLLGKTEQAEKFNDFYEGKVKEITDRVADVKDEDRPEALVWTAAGMMDCCSVSADKNFGSLLDALHAKNLGEDITSAENNTLTAEKMIEMQPENLIVTGGEWSDETDKTPDVRHVQLGYQSSPDKAQETLDGPLETPGLDLLEAPKNDKYFAVYHQFYDNPFNVFALEAFAKWLYPDKFEDMDAAKDFEDFHKDWLPFDYSGAFFAHNGDK